MTSAIFIEQSRGAYIESTHRGSAAIVDADGQIIWHAGDIDRPQPVNSALKLAQALPFIATGAADRWNCSTAEITLAAASQVGQERHRSILKAWFTRLGLPESALQCGVTEPRDSETRNTLIRVGSKPDVFHNNNVGKHIAVLATALHHGEPIDNYLSANHPAQLRICDAIARTARLTTVPAADITDRCSMPGVVLTLRQLATSSASIGTCNGLDANLALSAARLISAVREQPALLVGPEGFSTVICQSTGGRIIAKGGNEGVYTAVDTARGRGYALKVDDGAARAADVAFLWLLQNDAVLTADEVLSLSAYVKSCVQSFRHSPIGAIRITLRTE